MEVQTLAALGILLFHTSATFSFLVCIIVYLNCFFFLGSHENIVGYYTSWFENEQLYIQMELCDRSLSISKGQTLKGGEAFKIIYQVLNLFA